MTSPEKRNSRKRKRSASAKLRAIPHVLLMIETSGALGRGIIEGIGRYAAENGPWSIKYEYRALDTMPPQWLKEWRGDGIIARTFNAKQAKMLRETKLPRVELLGLPKYGIAEVRTDFDGEARLAVDHFWDRGLRQFAYFAGGEAWWIGRCFESFCRVLKERACPCQLYCTPISGQNMRSWNERYVPHLIKWLRGLSRPIGILTPGDIYAVHLLDLCREISIAVPEEMAILGRGNDSVICETVRPTLSSLDLGLRRVGYEAARMLDQKMRGKRAADEVIVSPNRVAIRQSTDLMVIKDSDVVQAMQFVRDHACTNIDVPRVAEEVGLSRRALERRFQQHLGRTPKEEIMRIRIETAKMLLAQTDNSRESIAHRCGFASPTYFSMAFHRVVGMKPQAYRKMCRISRDSAVE
jgi:LacI family transcriptional regulator